MKTILHLKEGDLFIQVLALVIPGICCLFSRDADALFFAYFTVGRVDALSVLANMALPEKYGHTTRPIAIWVLVGIISCFALAATGLGFIMLLALLFVSPVIAIWYGYITWCEIRTIARYTHRNQNVMTN
jgi:hypothetical protein